MGSEMCIRDSFPGGCIVEGLTLENAYDWKASVGPLAERRPNYNPVSYTHLTLPTIYSV